MKRLAATMAVCAALLNASAALAQRGPPAGATPTAPASTAQARPAFPGSIWTDPAGSFSFEKPRSWKEVETASVPGAAQLEVVAGDDKGQCWFTRVPRERTATLTPRQLIEARSQPIGAELWSRIAINQALLVGVAQVLDNSVEFRGSWPVQIARLQGRNGQVYAAIHSRPGADIMAFCAAKDNSNREDILNAVARSVTTPNDPHWQAQLGY